MGSVWRQVINGLRHPHRAWWRLRTHLGMGLSRLRWQFLQRRTGRTLWLRRGGYWLPFHNDGDFQELQYLYFGNVWFDGESRRLRPWLHPGSVAIDVGANLGFMSLVLAQHVGPAGKVFAFEPSPLVYPRLLEVINKNHVDNVRCFQRGCGAAQQTDTLLVPESSGNATIRRGVEWPNAVVREVEIEVNTLDAMILPEITQLDLLKIDTEGFEDQVLSGASELIARYRPVIYIELSQEYADSSTRAMNWLTARGYKFDREVDLTKVRNGDNFLALP